jgi:hypothetical protein
MAVYIFPNANSMVACIDCLPDVEIIKKAGMKECV